MTMVNHSRGTRGALRRLRAVRDDIGVINDNIGVLNTNVEETRFYAESAHRNATSANGHARAASDRSLASLIIGALALCVAIWIAVMIWPTGNNNTNVAGLFDGQDRIERLVIENSQKLDNIIMNMATRGDLNDMEARLMAKFAETGCARVCTPAERQVVRHETCADRAIRGGMNPNALRYIGTRANGAVKCAWTRGYEPRKSYSSYKKGNGKQYAPAHSSSSSSTICYVYDSHGRRTNMTHKVGSWGGSAGATWYSANGRCKITYRKVRESGDGGGGKTPTGPTHSEPTPTDDGRSNDDGLGGTPAGTDGLGGTPAGTSDQGGRTDGGLGGAPA